MASVRVFSSQLELLEIVLQTQRWRADAINVTLDVRGPSFVFCSPPELGWSEIRYDAYGSFKYRAPVTKHGFEPMYQTSARCPVTGKI